MSGSRAPRSSPRRASSFASPARDTSTPSIDDVIPELGITPRRAFGLFSLEADGNHYTREDMRRRCRTVWRCGPMRVGIVRHDARDDDTWIRGVVLVGAFDRAGREFTARNVGWINDAGRFVDSADVDAEDATSAEDLVADCAIGCARRRLAEELPVLLRTRPPTLPWLEFMVNASASSNDVQRDERTTP